MMSYWIHYTLKDGTEDKVRITGEHEKEVRDKAENFFEHRFGGMDNVTDVWSEPV